MFIILSLSLCFPMTFLSIPTSYPLPVALYRSSILHDMSEDAFEHCTPVMVLSHTRKESGKKPVRQNPRRRRRVSQRYEHAEEQVKKRRNDFHLQISSPRWRELDMESSDSSSTDESHWIQAKRQAHVKFRLSRRRRNNNKPCGNLAGSSTPDRIGLVDLESNGEKHQELTECGSHSLNICRGKVIRYQECSHPLPRASLVEKAPPGNHSGSKGKYCHRDPQPLHTLRPKETIKKRFSEPDFNTEILAPANERGCVDDSGLQLNTSTQKSPGADDDGSENFEVCRSVVVEKDLTSPKYIVF